MTQDDFDSALVEQCVGLYKKHFDAFITKGQTETDAQRHAISCSFEDALKNFGTAQATKVWQAVQSAHEIRKSGLKLPASEAAAVVKAVKSADQSWRKSSGHAFEQSFCRQLNAGLTATTSIRFRLQSEITELQNKGSLGNPEPDLKVISSWLKSAAFDVYATLQKPDDPAEYLFGCAQCKTSIRDRVTRDREPSTIAMEKFFWSIAVCLNGSFQSFQKFDAMVNGGSDDYRHNGWHAAYFYAGCTPNGRVKPLDSQFQPLLGDSQKAADKFLNERQWLNRDWQA